MAKPKFMELGEEVSIPILYEDRSVLAIDKPTRWMLLPYDWTKTDYNLQLAISSSIIGDDFWAKSRNLNFLKHVHRLDGETTGVLLFAKSNGGLQTFSSLFETRQMEKMYLAVVEGTPRQPAWSCSVGIAPNPAVHGEMTLDSKMGKEAQTDFKLLASRGGLSLIEARPLTGRTHQIRLHLLDAGLRIVGEPLYGRGRVNWRHPTFPMGLRAVRLGYRDPFTRRPVRIQAPVDEFKKTFGFNLEKPPVAPDVLS